jgi:hypothetical protein
MTYLTMQCKLLISPNLKLINQIVNYYTELGNYNFAPRQYIKFYQRYDSDR